MITAEEFQDRRIEATTRARVSVLVRRFLSGTVFPALLLLILLTSIPYGTVEPHWEAIFECAAFGLAVLSIVEVACAEEVNWNRFALLLPVLALLAFAFIQTLSLGAAAGSSSAGVPAWNSISADPFQTRRWILKVLAITLTGAMLLRYTSSRARLRALVILVLAVGVASALFGIFQQTTQRGKGFLFLAGLPMGTSFAQFVNKNHFAFLAEMALGLALGFIVSPGEKKERKLIYLAVSLPLWAGLVLCYSRGGLFSMLGQLFFLGVMWTVAGKKPRGLSSSRSLLEKLRGAWGLRLLLLCGLLAFILLGTLWMGGEPLASRLEAVPVEVGANAGSQQGASRIEIWRSTLSLIKDHPLLGVGFGGYWAAIPQYQRGSGELTPQEAHNDYLELLASGGLVGLALSGWFALIFIRKAGKAWFEATGYRRAALTGALTGIFGVALHSAVDFGLHITVNALVLTALLVIATARTKAPEPEQPA